MPCLLQVSCGPSSCMQTAPPPSCAVETLSIIRPDAKALHNLAMHSMQDDPCSLTRPIHAPYTNASPLNSGYPASYLTTTQSIVSAGSQCASLPSPLSDCSPSQHAASSPPGTLTDVNRFAKAPPQILDPASESDALPCRALHPAGARPRKSLSGEMLASPWMMAAASAPTPCTFNMHPRSSVMCWPARASSLAPAQTLSPEPPVQLPSAVRQT